MLKDFFRKLKIFLYGIITGIITAIMGYLYIKNQKIIKKIIKVKNGEKKDEIYSNLQSSDFEQKPVRNNIEKWRQVRQPDRDLGRR